MPALITHDQLGQDIYHELHGFIGETRDEYEAFLLGNQGPDPCFFAVLDPRLASQAKLGSTMHYEKPSELLWALKQSLAILEENERSIGRAYALGFLGHYVLDSMVHPFVFAQQYAVCDAGIEDLSREDGREVHAVIETELDELVLYTQRGQTVASFNPAQKILRASSRVVSVVSKIYGYLALSVYSTQPSSYFFEGSLNAYRIAQHLFYSPNGGKRVVLGHIERLVRRHSFYAAMCLRDIERSVSDFDNHEHHEWKNPFTDEVSTASFWDIYSEAQTRTKAALQAFDAPDFDLAASRVLTAGLNFSGEPVTATLTVLDK